MSNMTIILVFKIKIRYNLKINSPSSLDKVAELTERVLKACPVNDTLAGVPVTAVE